VSGVEAALTVSGCATGATALLLGDAVGAVAAAGGGAAASLSSGAGADSAGGAAESPSLGLKPQPISKLTATIPPISRRTLAITDGIVQIKKRAIAFYFAKKITLQGGHP